MTLTSARAGIARSGATRSNYIFVTTPPPTSADLAISIGGILTGAGATMRVLVASLTIRDALNEIPNTCQFTVQGARPAEGADVVIAYGDVAGPARIFGGSIIRVTQTYVGDNPANVLYQVEAIDWAWELTHKLVSARYTSQSASAIGINLLATYGPPGFTAVIYAGLPQIDEISFTMTPLLDCLAQLAGRIGGYAHVDYFKRVRLFLTPDPVAFPPPRPLGLTDPLKAFTITRDFTQLITRALVEGGGVNAATAVPPGETRLPVDDTAWYPADGAWVVAGPQRIRYTGIVAEGGGAMASAVGGQTGNTAPPAGPVVGTQAGPGLPVGVYTYAYTWVTPTGECLPSPLVPFNGGTAGGPGAAPTLALQTGAGLGLGRYRYVYTWTTATGETVPSPLGEVTTFTTTIPAPSAGPTCAAVTGAGLGIGRYRYVVTFATATGETPPSASTEVWTQTLGTISPSPGPLQCTTQAGTGVDAGQWTYAYTRCDANGESTMNNGRVITVAAPNQQVVMTGFATPYPPTSQKIYRASGNVSPTNVTQFHLVATIAANASTFTDTVPSASLGGNPPAVNTTGTKQANVSVTAIPVGPAGVTGRKLYRTVVGGLTFQLLTTLNNNTATTYTDTAPDANLGAAPPATNTTPVTTAQVAVSAIAAGPSGVTGRKLYRTGVGGTAYQLLTTIANNTTTTFTDTTPDASLGAAPPATGTAVLAQALLSGIAVGQAPTSTRRIYRTAVGGSALKLLTTLANNTATTFGPDTTPDASLGAAAPATDTSGLVSGSGGFVPAGSTTIPVASVAPFAPEGWALLAGLYIRYHGVSGTALTGIPATGPGSLGFSVPFNTPIAVVAQLTGIPASGAGRIALAIAAGDPVNVLAIVNDAAAQALVTAAIGGDGVIEGYDQDRRISYVEAVSRAKAMLDLKSTVLETVQYESRDPRSQSGAALTVALPAPTNVAGTYLVQDVTISSFTGVSDAFPAYRVTASSRRFSFEDLIRRRRG